MKYEPIDMSAFPPEREAALRNIFRYRMFDVVLYRSSLWAHEHRVLWLTEELLPLAQQYLTLDAEKARAIAIVHDDAEILTGDVQAGEKARMTREQLLTVEQNEEKAIDELSARYPEKFAGYSYRALLTHMLKKDCPEAQFVSVMDKLDAYCESLHEVLAGNISLLSSLLFYTRAMARFPMVFPTFKEFLASNEHALLLELVPEFGNVGPGDFSAFNRPHTAESLSAKSRFPFYDEWKRIVVARGGEEGIRWLTEAKESVQ